MATIKVTITKSKRKGTPYSYTIDKPGRAAKETKREWYTRRSTAKRGALRSLGAQWNDDGYWEAPAGSKGVWYRIEFNTK